MKTEILYLHPLLYPVKYRGTPIFVFSTAGLSRCLPRLNPAFNGGASRVYILGRGWGSLKKHSIVQDFFILRRFMTLTSDTVSCKITLYQYGSQNIR